MENITLGQIAIALAFLVGLIGSIEFLTIRLKKSFNKLLEPINQKIDKFQEKSEKRYKNLEISMIKTDLVNFLSMAENDKNTKEQTINAHELYDKYKKLGGNSYIHAKWEKLTKEGKI